MAKPEELTITNEADAASSQIMTKQYYAVYSELQKHFAGEIEYSTPDGGTVLVTEISLIPGCPDNRWPDKRDVGKVKAFIRRVSTPKRQCR